MVLYIWLQNKTETMSYSLWSEVVTLCWWYCECHCHNYPIISLCNFKKERIYIYLYPFLSVINISITLLSISILSYHLAKYLFVYLSIYLSSIHSPICLSVCPPLVNQPIICLSIHLPVFYLLYPYISTSLYISKNIMLNIFNIYVAILREHISLH